MTQVADEKITFMANYSRLAHQGANGHAWLHELRQQGINRFHAVGFPSNKEEDWRHTNVAPIAKIPFAPAHQADGAAAAREFGFKHEASAEIVFVNGFFSPELSNLKNLPRGVKVMSLADAVASEAQTLQQHLGQYAKVEANPFVALNTGFIREGVYVHIGRSVTCEKPIHLLFITMAGPEPFVAHPRVLVVAEQNCEAAIVETYAGPTGVYFNNSVTEIVAAEDSRIDHCRLQQESLEAFHVSTMQVQLAAKAVFVSHAATLGGKLTRNDLNVVLNGEHADATLNGLVLIGGEQHCDNHTLLHHEKANCPSHELYKHVLNGRATGVFRGKIFVQKDAQKTDSKQTSKSLLLSDEAYMNSQPALEIYADDVKCTHGSTTGPVDEDAVFYFRTRGVGLEAARHLLTYAFAADVTRRIRIEPVRRRLEDYMAAQHDLPQDLRITDVGSHDLKAI